MTPAIHALKAAAVSYRLEEYDHAPGNRDYGEEAAEALGLSTAEVFKTLLGKLDDRQLVVAIVPVSCRLDLKALARAGGAKKARLADPQEAQRATGYVLGGISPLGQKHKLATFLDSSAESLGEIHVSGGRRGLEVALSPTDLLALTQGNFAALQSR
ncbi:Cys-tRNA(Pro) deacylase [Pistricoccus aurantiacus]|uniref:Cys-tRNA(Pro) deacylase n=1 Tax=Pistricoccus aurantiacus TaxID=1883414 RepID=UPI003639F280